MKDHNKILQYDFVNSYYTVMIITPATFKNRIKNYVLPTPSKGAEYRFPVSKNRVSSCISYCYIPLRPSDFCFPVLLSDKHTFKNSLIK